MPHKNLLTSIDFTRSIGRTTPNDAKFNDAAANNLGNFPTDQKIRKISSLQVYTSEAETDPFAIIVGLRVGYVVLGQPNPIMITHGKETQHSRSFDIPATILLVGASGLIKNLPQRPEDGRISSIMFTLYNSRTGATSLTAQCGNASNTNASYGTYGPIIAFHGTRVQNSDLTSLGFVKLVQGLPGLGIAGHDD